MSPEQEQLIRGLLDAYSDGLFPMADPETEEIAWYDPDPRAIIPLDGLRVSRSLRQRVRSARFRITTDTAFERVIMECAAPRPGGEDESWIDDRIVHAYCTLHEAGHAHSIEAWLGDTNPVLVGGLYGVGHRGLFAGESMFSRPELGGTDASKVCLVHLVAHMRERGFTLLDTQFSNPHLDQFGCAEIPRAEYKRRLRDALAHNTTWLPFDPAAHGV